MKADLACESILLLTLIHLLLLAKQLLHVDVRYYHHYLLIRRALELRFGLQSLRPCLLAYGSPRVRFFFVQRVKLAEVDLFIEEVLERRGDVVGMVVYMIMRFGVLGVVAVAMVVMVGHGGETLVAG